MNKSKRVRNDVTNSSFASCNKTVGLLGIICLMRLREHKEIGIQVNSYDNTWMAHLGRLSQGLLYKAQVLQNCERGALQVERVHVQAWRAGLQQAAAHLRAQLNAVRLDCLVTVLDLLQVLTDLSRNGCLAERGHALESAICHDGHDACTCTGFKVMNKVAPMQLP